MIDLDANATTRPADEVVAAVASALRDAWHNPSSIHRAGQRARAVVELAREEVASLLGARPSEVVFTSGGTESIDMAIRGVLGASRRRALVTTGIEHAAVRGAAARAALGGVEVRLARLTPEGVVDLDHLASLIDRDVALVSVQWVNNETGAIQPVREAAERCRARGAAFHCDATQRVGKLLVKLGSGEGEADLDADLLTLSAHKFHGPKGVGALIVRNNVKLAAGPPGEQERGVRGGTENVPGIAGIGAAARLARAWLADESNIDRARAIRDALERAILGGVPGASLNGPPAAGRIWNTANIAFEGAEAESMLLMLSERGVCASAGAACSSGSLEPSPVLLAMGLPTELASSSVRLSISRETTRPEALEGAQVVIECARSARTPR